MASDSLAKLIDIVSQPYWERGDFWISILISIIGAALSAIGLNYARGAKQVAESVSKQLKTDFLKKQLADLTSKLSDCPSELSYDDARKILIFASNSINTTIGYFENTNDHKALTESLVNSLNEAKTSLKELQSGNQPKVSTDSIYYGMEGHFSNISALISRLLGKLDSERSS